jgi:hypothetical protein
MWLGLEAKVRYQAKYPTDISAVQHKHVRLRSMRSVTYLVTYNTRPSGRRFEAVYK